MRLVGASRRPRSSAARLHGHRAACFLGSLGAPGAPLDTARGQLGLRESAPGSAEAQLCSSSPQDAAFSFLAKSLGRAWTPRGGEGLCSLRGQAASPAPTRAGPRVTTRLSAALPSSSNHALIPRSLTMRPPRRRGWNHHPPPRPPSPLGLLPPPGPRPSPPDASPLVESWVVTVGSSGAV